VAAVVTQRQPTVFESSVTMVVQTSAGASDTDVLVRTMIALVGSEVVGEALKEATQAPLAADEISANLSVERPPGSSVLTVTYVDTDLERSVAIARSVTPVFQQQVRALEVDQAGQLAPNYAIQPWGSGTVITSELSQPVLRNAAIALLLGGLVAAVAGILYRQFHPVIRDRRDAEQATGLAVLSSPPLRSRGRRAATWHPGDLMEAVVRRLPQALGDDVMPRRILVVGPEKSAQRAAFVAHLARALSQDGTVTTLVDADLESGSLSRHAGLSRVRGLADCLRTGLAADEAVVVPDHGLAEGLPVLAAGHKLPVRSGSAAVVLAAFSSGQLVVDGPAPSAHQPLSPLVRSVDAVLVLVTAGSTSFADAATVTSVVRSLGTASVATVLVTDEPDQTSGIPSVGREARPGVRARRAALPS
jgi:capsular polysaccharide biosynthesis protein